MLKFIFLVRDQKFYFAQSKTNDGQHLMNHDDLAIKYNLRPPQYAEYFNEIFYPFASLGVEINNSSPILLRSAEIDFTQNLSYTVDFNTSLSTTSTGPGWINSVINDSDSVDVLMRDFSLFLSRSGDLWLPAQNDRYPNMNILWIDLTGGQNNTASCWYD